MDEIFKEHANVQNRNFGSAIEPENRVTIQTDLIGVFKTSILAIMNLKMYFGNCTFHELTPTYR
jgi:hypothetical protein